VREKAPARDAMSSISLKVATPGLVSFQDELAQFGVIAKRRVLSAMGGGVKLSLIEHFAGIEQDSVHHKWATQLGANRTHFYGGSARGVQSGIQDPKVEGDDAVSVSINSQGLAQRYFGGTITAKNKKWLTIPAIAAAYGRPANSFNNLRFVLFRPDLAALIEKTPGQPSTLSKQTRKDSKGIYRSAGETSERGRVVYWLKRSVEQAPDPTVLPTEDEMSQRAIEAGHEAIDHIGRIGGLAS